MRFADPWYLILFVVVAAGYLYYRWMDSVRTGVIPYSGVRQAARVPRSGFFRSRTVLLVLRALSISLFILALARPQQGQRSTELSAKGIDIILCIDTSTSMRALDFKPLNRLDAAKDAAREFVKNRKHDRIGIVVFAGMSFTQCPLTLDYGAVLDFLDRVSIGMTNIDGTAIGTALVTALNRLKDSDAKSKIVILLTDGRNNAGEIDPVTASKTAEAIDVKIYTIGAGRPGESIYPIDDPFFGTRYVTLPEDLDEGTLQAIAKNTGGMYFRAKTAGGLKDIYGKINQLEKTEIKVQEYLDYNDLYLWFLVMGFILLVSEIVLGQTILRKIP